MKVVESSRRWWVTRSLEPVAWLLSISASDGTVFTNLIIPVTSARSAKSTTPLPMNPMDEYSFLPER